MDEQHGDPGFEAGSNNGDGAEMYLLKWNSHQNHFASKFSELLDEDDISFADVTLACEGHFLQAHRLVLSVCSPYFKNLFKVNCAEKGPATIVLANIRYTDLENILHFIYRGQVNVKKEDLNNFLETGEQLQIDGLVGQGQSKQGSSAVKRRFSEGGQVLGRASAQQHGHGSHLVNRGGHRGSTQPHQTQYKIVAGNTSRMSSASSGSQNNHSNHTENHVKKARISPTISSASVVKAESVIANASARRPSTSSSVLQNSTTSPSHAAAGKSEEVDHEVCENNGIKILAVASINSASGNAGYDAQGNDVFEILDYEDDDRPENDMEDSELMGSYCEGGEDGLYYAYQQSSPTYGRTPNSQGFSLPSRPLVSARYPSIIDGVHFDLISADEKRVAAQCKLCPGEKIIRGSGLTSSNFISHLRAFHKRELEEWREKRKTETKRRLD